MRSQRVRHDLVTEEQQKVIILILQRKELRLRDVKKPLCTYLHLLWELRDEGKHVLSAAPVHQSLHQWGCCLKWPLDYPLWQTLGSNCLATSALLFTLSNKKITFLYGVASRGVRKSTPLFRLSYFFRRLWDPILASERCLSFLGGSFWKAYYCLKKKEISSDKYFFPFAPIFAA